MLKTLRIAVMSLAVGMASIAAQPAFAQGGIYLGFGTGHGPRVGVEFGTNRHHFDRRQHRANRNWDRGCEPGRALNKAKAMGLRKAHVRDVNRHVVRIGGQKYGHRVNYTFANRQGCPLIR